jgi:AraC-like DNA-binding protein
MGSTQSVGRAPAIPLAEVSVAVHRCERPARPVAVEYPGMRGGHLLLLQRSGAFHLSSSRHDLVVDPTVSVFGRAGEPAEIAHPYGQGDDATYVVLSGAAFDALGGSGRSVPGVAPATGLVIRLHHHLLRLLSPVDDWMAVEDAALQVFMAALEGADGCRIRGTSPVGRRQGQVVDNARGLLAADPAVNSLVDLGRRVGCSPHHLSRLFHEHTGKTLVRYRLELRVHRALDRMRDPDVSLAQVAAEAGFADHAHLTRSVRQLLGTTPSELRRR